MSHVGRKIGGSGDGPVDASDILAALAKDKSADDRRRHAVRRCLSAGDDWREASAELGGAFASDEGWLRRDKGE